MGLLCKSGQKPDIRKYKDWETSGKVAQHTCCWLSMESSSLLAGSGSCGWLLFWLFATEFSGPKSESCPSMVIAWKKEESEQCKPTPVLNCSSTSSSAESLEETDLCDVVVATTFCWCSKSCFWNCSRFCCWSCSASWWKRELLMGSDTMGLEAASGRDVKWPWRWSVVINEPKDTHSWDEDVSFLDSSLRSESLPKSKGPKSFCIKTRQQLHSKSLCLGDDALLTCSSTLLKEETLCSRGLRLLAVAAAVSCAVSACNCTTRPASRACSRDGWSFCCCCICTLWTSCCSYNGQFRTALDNKSINYMIHCVRRNSVVLLASISICICLSVCLSHLSLSNSVFQVYSEIIQACDSLQGPTWAEPAGRVTHLLTLRTLQDLRHRGHSVRVGDLWRPVRQTLNYVGWRRRSGWGALTHRTRCYRVGRRERLFGVGELSLHSSNVLTDQAWCCWPERRCWGWPAWRWEEESPPPCLTGAGWCHSWRRHSFARD